jgi:hypothetical protein
MRNNAVAVSNMNLVVQSTKQLAADTSSVVESLQQTVNDILHGNIRDISANDINTTSAHIGEIIFNYEEETEVIDGVQHTTTKESPIKIYSYDGENQYGEFDGSVLRYKNIESERVDVSTITPAIIGISSDGISFNQMDNGTATENVMLSITENGNLSAEDININYNIDSSAGKDVIDSTDDASLYDIWNDIEVHKLQVDSMDLSLVYPINVNQKYIQTKVDEKGEGLSKTHLDVKTIIQLLIWKIKKLEETIATLSVSQSTEQETTQTTD